MRRGAATLTERRIQATKAVKGRDVKLCDATVPGLTFRVRESGRREFLFSYTAKGGPKAGKRRYLALGIYGTEPPALTLERARARAGELAGRVRDKFDPIEESKAALAAAKKASSTRGQRSIEALAASFIADHAKPHKRSWREDQRKINRDILPAWKGRPAAEITREDVVALVRQIGRGEGPGRRAAGDRPRPAAARAVLALLSTMFNWALDVGGFGVTVNPAARVPKAPAGRRDRVLGEEEVRAFWQALDAEPPLYGAAFRLLLLTGLRKEELLAATWHELEEDSAGLWLSVPAERSKNGVPHRLPLSTLAASEVRKLRELADGSEFLFPSYQIDKHLTEIRPALRRVQVRAKLAHFVTHDLRRTAATLMGAAGVAPHVIDRVLNHVDAQHRGVTFTYVRHSYGPEMRAALETLAQRLANIVTGDSARVVPFGVRKS